MLPKHSLPHYVISMCVLELGLLSGAVEMAFIVVTMQFNFGNASAFECKSFFFFFCTFSCNLWLSEEL